MEQFVFTKLSYDGMMWIFLHLLEFWLSLLHSKSLTDLKKKVYVLFLNFTS